MKKILAIAIATAISAPAMADLTIGGSADYLVTSTDGNASDSIETNLDITASTTAESGAFIKAYLQLESINAADAGTDQDAATAGVQSAFDIDDNYVQVGNASASVTLGSFGVMSAFNTGDDDFQVDANDYNGHGLWLASGAQDVALNVTVSEALSVQYATTLDSTDTDAYQVAATYAANGLTVVAEYEDAGTDATKGFAVSAATDLQGVGVVVSYAKNEEDMTSAVFQANYSGFQLNVQNDDSGNCTATGCTANTNETSWYGKYTMPLADLAGVSLTVGAGADDASDKFGARIDYKF